MVGEGRIAGGRKVKGRQEEMEERLRREPEAQAVPACGGWFFIKQVER